MSRPDRPHIPPRDFALSIVRTLRDNGHIAYFAGGCVRDELLGLEPKDYDVATDATPDRIAALFPRTEEVGARFGVVIVKSRGQMVEVATFRADGPYSDRRRPDAITFSDPPTDAARRDFTINALFLDPFTDPLADPAHAVIDFVGGVADIRSKTLRAVGDPDARFREDDLRVLRAIRFAARFALTIHPETSAAIRRHAGQLGGISRERVGDEVRRMLLHPSRVFAAGLLAKHELTKHVLGIDSLPHLARHDFPLLAAMATDNLGALLAAWLLDLGLSGHCADAAKSPATAAAQKLRHSLSLSNVDSHDFIATLEGSNVLRNTWLGLAIAHQKRIAFAPWFASALSLVTAQSAQTAQLIKQRLAALAASDGGIHPPPLISGDDLTALGLPPGPAFKDILARVYDAQLEARIRTREQALELVRRICV